MIDRLIFLTVVSLMTAGTTHAADRPLNIDDCMQQVFELANSAQNKKLSDAKLNQIESLLTKMENYCSANELAKAARMHDEILATIRK
jgi:hypothetical protein